MFSIILRHKAFEYLLLTIGLFLGFVFIIHVFSHQAYLILTGIALAGGLIYALSRVPGAFILFYILLSITFLENDPGITAIEIPFYAFTSILVLYTLLEIMRGGYPLDTFLDKMMFLLLLIIPVYVFWGIVNGASIYLAFGETSYLFGLLIYLPLRKHMAKQSFNKILWGIVLCIVAYVLIRNLINYRQILLQALLPWQAQKARVASNEFILMFGALLWMAAAAITPSRKWQYIFTISFLATLGGLILTQSRGYWLAFFLGMLVLFYTINKKGKVRITLTFMGLFIPSIFILYFFFYEQLSLVLSGLAERFQTLFSGSLDRSMYERVLESKTVFNHIVQNPIAGYGFGVTYTKKLLFSDYFIQTSYVHNGYLATWFKLGILGLFLVYTTWLYILAKSVALYRKTTNITTQIVSLTIASTIAGVLLVNNTSPQILTFETVFFISIFAAFLSTTETNKNV